MLKYFRIPAAVAIVAMLCLSACGGNSSDKSSETMQDSVKTASSYYCPMKCEGNKTYPKTGSCPVCGMDLVATDDAMHDGTHESSDHMHESNDNMHESNEDMHK